MFPAHVDPGPALEPARPVRGLRTAPLLALLLVVYAWVTAVFFFVAGRIDLPWAWVAFAILGLSEVVLAVTVFRRDPELVQERLYPGPGVPAWDRAITTALAVLVPAALVVAALDLGHFHATDRVPLCLHVIGLASLVSGLALMGWSMHVNTFFSRVVRVQRDRGQRVISSGPYRFVRHPGYLGWILLWTGMSLALGSWLGVGVALLGNVVVVIRTALEDDFLRRDLDGYADYTREVRYRLLPGAW